jgi:hypothetical protein
VAKARAKSKKVKRLLEHRLLGLYEVEIIESVENYKALEMMFFSCAIERITTMVIIIGRRGRLRRERERRGREKVSFELDNENFHRREN